MPQPLYEIAYQAANLSRMIEVIENEFSTLDFGSERDGTRNHTLDRISTLISVTLDIAAKTASDLEESSKGGTLLPDPELPLTAPVRIAAEEGAMPSAKSAREEEPEAAVWNPPRFPGFVANPAFIPGAQQFPAEYPQIVDPVLALIDVAASARAYFYAHEPKNRDLEDDEIDARFAATTHPFHDAIVHATPTPLTPQGALALCDYVIEHEETLNAPAWLLALHDFIEKLAAKQEVNNAA